MKSLDAVSTTFWLFRFTFKLHCFFIIDTLPRCWRSRLLSFPFPPTKRLLRRTLRRWVRKFLPYSRSKTTMVLPHWGVSTSSVKTLLLGRIVDDYGDSLRYFDRDYHGFIRPLTWFSLSGKGSCRSVVLPSIDKGRRK